MNFWRLGTRVVAVAGTPQAFVVGSTEHGVGAQADFAFARDANDKEGDLGQPAGTVFVNNLPHSAEDADGFVWSAVMAFVPKTAQTFDAWSVGKWGMSMLRRRLIYKIDPELGNRTVVAQLPISTAALDLNLCTWRAKVRACTLQYGAGQMQM